MTSIWATNRDHIGHRKCPHRPQTMSDKSTSATVWKQAVFYIYVHYNAAVYI